MTDITQESLHFFKNRLGTYSVDYDHDKLSAVILAHLGFSYQTEMKPIKCHECGLMSSITKSVKDIMLEHIQQRCEYIDFVFDSNNLSIERFICLNHFQV